MKLLLVAFISMLFGNVVGLLVGYLLGTEGRLIEDEKERRKIDK